MSKMEFLRRVTIFISTLQGLGIIKTVTLVDKDKADKAIDMILDNMTWD